MIPTYSMPLANHLWQSSAFAGAAGCLCLLLRRNRASLRHRVWLIASVKFLIPFALLVRLGSLFESPAVPPLPSTPLTSLAATVGRPFALAAPAPLLAAVPDGPSRIPMLLLAVWCCGFGVSAFGWLRAWLRMRSAVRGATLLPADLSPHLPGRRLVPLAIWSPVMFAPSSVESPHGQPIRLMASPALVEPCVFGIFRPVLLLPEGLRHRLTPSQLEAIFLHESCHVRRGDNLTAALQMLVETVFWFYPLTHWIGKRLMDERESACDEEVLRVGARPETYAQGILTVCRLGLQPSGACAAGVAGSDLKKRIEGIMEYRGALRLGFGRKLLLAAVATAALVGPFLTGMLLAPSSEAQSQSATAADKTFAVAAIKPNRTGARNSGFRRFTGGQLDATNITLKMLIAFAYDIPQDRILQAPGWTASDRYDILAKPDSGADQTPNRSMDLIRLRTQALLADRFHLTLHKETRQLPVFRLLVDNGGPKNLHAPKGNSPDLTTNGHHVDCQAASMEFFAKVFLTGQMHAPVLDQTGITGKFDFSMDWTPDDNPPPHPGDPADERSTVDPMGPSLFRALKEQLGLKLEAGKGPVEVLLVDHAEKPSEN